MLLIAVFYPSQWAAYIRGSSLFMVTNVVAMNVFISNHWTDWRCTAIIKSKYIIINSIIGGGGNDKFQTLSHYVYYGWNNHTPDQSIDRMNVLLWCAKKCMCAGCSSLAQFVFILISIHLNNQYVCIVYINININIDEMIQNNNETVRKNCTYTLSCTSVF